MKYSSGQCLISLTVGFDLAYSHIITYFENSVITVRFESIVFTSVSPEIIIQVLLIEMACGAKLDCSPESKNFLVQACFVYLITNCNGVSHLMQKNFVIIWMRSLYFEMKGPLTVFVVSDLIALLSIGGNCVSFTTIMMLSLNS